MSPPLEVETLLPQLQDTLAQIKSTISELSSSAQDDELDQLEQRRDQLLADLQKSFQKEKEELESKRQSELDEIKKKRQREDEERDAQRRREDDEFQKAKSNEEQKQKQNYDHEVDSIEDETEKKMDEVEQTVEKKIEEGKKKLHDLDEKRKELNRRIDDQLTQPLPASPSRRKRSKERTRKDPSEPAKDQLNKPESKPSDDKPEKPEDKLSKNRSNKSENELPKDVPEKQQEALPNEELKKQVDTLPKDKPEGKSGQPEDKLPKDVSEKPTASPNDELKQKDDKLPKDKLEDKSGKPEDKLPKDKGLPKDVSEKSDNVSPDDELKKQDDKFSKDKPADKTASQEKSKKEEKEPQKTKSTKQEDVLPQDELKKKDQVSKPNGEKDESPKEKSKKPDEEPAKSKTKTQEDGLPGDDLKKQPGGLPDQPINHEYEQPNEKPKKQEDESSKKKSKKREDDSEKNVINGNSVIDGQKTGESSPKPKKDSSPKPKKSDSKSDTPSKSRPPVSSSPERHSEPKKDGELPFQENRTTVPPQAAKTPAKNARRSFAEALKSNMSNGSKDIPDHEESNATDATQQQELPGELASMTTNIKPGAETYRSEIVRENAEDTSAKHLAETFKSENFASGESEEKGDEGASHSDQLSSRPVESLDRISNNSTKPNPPEELEQSKQTAPDQPSSGYPFISSKQDNSKVPNAGGAIQRNEPQYLTGQLHTEIGDKTGLQESTKSTEGTSSPKTPERLPIRNRAASESAKTDCQSVDSEEAVQSKRLSTTPDKRRRRQQDGSHNQMELGQSAVSYFPEQSQSKTHSSASNVIRQSQASQHPSQGQVETRFAEPPSPIQGDLVFSLDKHELDVSPKAGKPMGFENIQNSNSEFLHVISQQGREKVTSPLPVENETVRGEDQLFDENRSMTDFSEHEEEPELLPHTPLEDQGHLVLFESPFQPIFDDQGLTSLIGAFEKWATLIKEINEQTDGGYGKPFLLEFPRTSAVEEHELLQTQSTAATGDLRENNRGKLSQPTPGVRQSTPQASSETLSHHVGEFACEDRSNQSRLNSLPCNPRCIDDQVSHSLQNGPIQSLCNNVLTGLVGSTAKRVDVDSRNIPPDRAHTPKRKLRSSSTEPQQHKKQRGRQRQKSCQSSERDINPRGQLFQNSDNEVDIRSSWFKHSRRGLD